MNLSRFALRHRRALLFSASALAVAGFVAARTLPTSVYPEIAFPREQIVAELGSAPAATVLAGVTRPLETAMSAIPGLRTVRSKTLRGAAEISLFFDPSADMAAVHALVTARLGELRAELPAGTQVQANRVLPSGFPILSINVEGPYPPQQLYEIAEYSVRPALSGLPGIGPVTVQSSDLPEYEVLLDPARLFAAHLSTGEVADRLRQANVVAAVARRTDAHEQELAVVTGELGDAADIGAVVVGGSPEAPLRLRDLGTVAEGVVPRTTIVRVDGRPGAILNIPRQVTGDAIELDAAVRARLAELQPSLPPGLVFKPVYEQAAFVADAVSGLRDAVLIGALCAVLVLGLFLRNLRATFCAALSLPLTLGLTLLVLKGLGQSLNLMTLGGLAVAIGLVIDDAVVVIEAIHRGMERGLSAVEAARQGSEDLFWPVVGTTVTTVVVFLPLALLAGVAGQFFVALATALGAAVLLSLPVALLVLPGVAATLMRPVTVPPGDLLERVYGRALEWVIPRRRSVLLAVGGFVGFAALFVHGIPSDFLPEADEGSYVIDYRAPVAASLDDADQLARAVEGIVAATPEVASFSRRLGTELGPAVATLPSSGDIAVRLKSERQRGIQEIMNAQREAIAALVPGIKVEFIQVLSDMLGDLQGAPEPIEIKLFGPDPTVLRRLAREVSARIAAVPGLVDFFDGDEGCAPERDYRVQDDSAARHGLTATAIADQLAAANLGEIATQIRRPDHLLDVRVREAPPQEIRSSSLVAGPTGAGGGGMVAATALLRSETSRCPPAVARRENQRNMVHLTARLEGTSLGQAVSALRSRMRGFSLPIGYTWELGGLATQQEESFRALAEAMLVAIFAVCAVLLFQLRSFTRAGAILAMIPVALAAAGLTLRVTGISLNVSSLMGAILLVGLVVKNGVLLLDEADVREARGEDRASSVRAAARVRLRPILMTTLATLAALVPLALGLGAGAALHRPLAVVVLGGLFTSTLATLLVVPLLALSGRRDAQG